MQPSVGHFAVFQFFSTWTPTTFFLPTKQALSLGLLSLSRFKFGPANNHQNLTGLAMTTGTVSFGNLCPLQTEERKISLQVVRNKSQDLCLSWHVFSFRRRALPPKALPQLLKKKAPLTMLCSSEQLLSLSGLSAFSAVPCWLWTHAFARVLSALMPSLCVRGCTLPPNIRRRLYISVTLVSFVPRDIPYHGPPA